MSRQVIIEEGQQYISRRHSFNIAIIKYRSADGGIGYRIKGERHQRYSLSAKAFLRNWSLIQDTGSDDQFDAENLTPHATSRLERMRE